MSMVPKEKVTDMMQRCQRGVRVPGDEERYHEANDLLAECFATIGGLSKDRREALKLLYDMSRHVQDTETPEAEYHVKTAKLLAEVRALDPAIFDRMMP